MAANVNELGVVKVAAPCQRDWDKMSGDAKVRFCGDCQQNVYNLSELTTDEAHQLIREKEGKLCVRFYTRDDGTVLTRDCPVGLQRKRKKLIAAGAATISMSLAALAFSVGEIFAEAPSEACEALPVKPPEGQPGPTAQAVKPEPDDSWMQRRRGQLGAREPGPRRAVMGGMKLDIIRRDDEKKP